ncbi:DUF1569 domain-containing protein [Paludisphaera rhizosphaerae]|uniref:DUF1569 domain-containing protein n=1 Tax=Paludisphaera rhizosphaerae TaxID=2711216 RepID=UPI0013EBD78A|nr:DUF1569 domain-containing protein [Paludisphaera rhizosphaerae]
MSTATERRRLKFQDLQDAVREAEALHAGGYRRLGKWDLSQVCGHLADWLTFPVDGFPKPPTALRAVMFVVRNTVAPAMLRKTLATGEMPGGAPTMPATVPSPGGDEAEALARFRRAVERFQAHEGDYLPSPLFGQASREDANRMQIIHCAHHLGYLIPNA